MWSNHHLHRCYQKKDWTDPYTKTAAVLAP